MRCFKRNILLLLTGIFGYISMYYATGAASNSAGDRTNSPFSSGTCGSTGCHSGGSFAPVISVQLMSGTTAISRYIPDSTYTLVITTTSSTGIGAGTHYGFQAVAVNSSNADANGWGTLPAGTHSTIVSARTYIEQSVPSTSNTVTIPWTAPAVGFGQVSFYISSAIVNFNGAVSGDNATSTSITIDEGCNDPVLSATHINASCFGSTNGSISLTAAGGSPPYSYSWTAPGFTSTAQNITGLAAGTYAVAVTGGNCTSTSSYTVSQPTTTPSHTNVSCNGGNNGTAGVTVNGLLPPYSYSWSGPSLSSSSQNVSGLLAGTYNISVTTASGCVINNMVAITQPNQLNVSASGTIACTGQSFTLSAIPSGGTSPYSYSWSGPNGFTSNQQHPVITNTTGADAGLYSVLVTDANLCTKTAAYSVVVSTTPNYSIEPTPVSCNNANDGSVSISVGGASQYTFLWSGPNGYSSTGLNIASLIPGLYTIVVTTGNGCTITASAVVTQPLGIAASASSNSPVCTGGIINLMSTVSGGTGNYTYSWTGPNGFTSSSSAPIISPATTPESGNYTVVIKDINQCSKSSTIAVSVSPGPTLSSTVTNAVCNGASTGAINLAVGGVAPGGYTCAWTGPAGYISTNQNITGLAAGTYGVNVALTGGCIDHLSANVIQPPPFQIYTSINTPVCNGGSLSLSGGASGGAGGLMYSWTGPNGFSFAGSATSIRPVGYGSSGNYVFTVTDGLGCTGSRTMPVSIDTVPVPVVTPANVLCNRTNTGAISATATGGGPFLYLWTGPNGYAVNAQNISNLAPGTYHVVVTSALGCVGTASATVNDVAPITGSASSNGPVCGGGTLRLTASATGGTGTFTYAWTGPNLYSANQQNPVIASASVAASGIYSLNVTDSNHCVNSVSLPVNIIPAPVFNFTTVNERCFGNTNGSISLTTTGGLPPFSYQWSGPTGYSNTSQNINNLVPGVYHLIISGGGCQAVYNDTVVITQPQLLKDSVIAGNVCAGSPLGLTAMVTGGTQPYTYNWAGPSAYVANAAGPVIAHTTPANAGIYSLLVTDANNCISTGTATATVLPIPQVHLGNDTDICRGNSIILDAGNTGERILWSRGDTTQHITVFVQGIYSATATDAIGCTGTDTILVRVDSALRISAIGATNTNNTFTFVPINATGVNSYQWYFGDNSTAQGQVASHTYAATGSYTVALVGSNACGNDTLIINIHVDSVTGVPRVAASNNNVHIFPNPARDRITITGDHVPMKHLRIASATGSIVHEENEAFADRYTIDVSGLASGLYIIYIDTGSATIVSKVDVIR